MIYFRRQDAPAAGAVASVTLLDGTTADSSSPEWKLNCLARHVLALPGLDQRRAWLADFEKRHGPDAANALKQGMSAAHKKAPRE